MVIEPQKTYTGTIKTNKGNIEIELFAKDAPFTVNNFIFLARDGFYDGLIFHRVIPNFIAQGGDPTGSGMGGPGYEFQDEVDDKHIPHKHKTGALSMANAGPNSNGSQFFIVYARPSHLDGKHTVFAQVTFGMDVARSLENGDQIETIEIRSSDNKTVSTDMTNQPLGFFASLLKKISRLIGRAL